MNHNSAEYFSLRSMFVYVLKHYKSLIIGLIIGAIVLLFLSFIMGWLSETSDEKGNIIESEDLKDAKQDLEDAEENLDNLQRQLESQQENLKTYKNNLSEYEKKWAADIYIQTSASDRSAIDTVYQFSGNERSVAQVLNMIFTSSGSMYQEIALQLDDGKTAYNVQELFTVTADTDIYQLTVNVSDETQNGAEKLQELSREWIENKFDEYRQIITDGDVNMVVSQGDVYTYFDTDIFSEQMSAKDKEISLNNSINSEQNSITTTKTNIEKAEKDIEEYEKTVEKLKANEERTVRMDGRNLNIRSIVIFIVLGAIIGVIVVAVVYIIIFLYGRKLRDPEDLETRTCHQLLGVLWQPPYRPGKDKVKRSLDRWNGVDYSENPDESVQRLALAIQLKINQNDAQNVMMTGTVDNEEVEQIYQKIIKELSADIAQCLSWGGDPLSDLSTAERFLDVDAVILVEKVGSSEVRNIRRLRDYLSENKIRLFGGIAI